MDIKVIVLDIDGTLINDDKEILTQTKEIIKKVQNDNIKVILASGRPTNGMIEYAKELQLDKNQGFIVSYNGAKVINMQDNQIYFNQTLDAKVAKSVLKHLSDYEVIPMIDNDKYLFVEDVYSGMIDIYGEKFNIIRSEKKDNNLKLCEVNNLFDYTDELNKILIAGNASYMQENIMRIMSPYLEKVKAEFSEDYLLEIIHKDVNKAVGIQIVLDILQVPSENIMVFGDGENDISMLKMAGVSVVMDNANDEVKKHGDIITNSNNLPSINNVIKDYLY